MLANRTNRWIGRGRKSGEIFPSEDLDLDEGRDIDGDEDEDDKGEEEDGK